VSAYNEVRATTPEAAKQIAGLASKMGVGISPERLSRATSKMIPTSNPIASGLVDLYDMPFKEKEQRNAISTIQSVPALRSFVRFSRAIDPRERTIADARRLRIPTEGRINQDILNDIQDAQRDKSDARSPANLGLDELLNGTPTREDVVDYIKKNATSGAEASRLKRKAKARRPEIFK